MKGKGESAVGRTVWAAKVQTSRWALPLSQKTTPQARVCLKGLMTNARALGGTRGTTDLIACCLREAARSITVQPAGTSHAQAQRRSSDLPAEC